MVFYKITADLADESETESSKKRRIVEEDFISVTSQMFSESCQTEYIFLEKHMGRELTMGYLSVNNPTPNKKAREFLRRVGLAIAAIRFTEITLHIFCSMVHRADTRYIIDDNEVIQAFSIDSLRYAVRLHECSEALVSDNTTKRAITKGVNLSSCKKSLGAEIQNIFLGSKVRGAKGHPVHYIVATRSEEDRRSVTQLLLAALYRSGRIQSRRYLNWTIRAGTNMNPEDCDLLFHSCAGGAIVITVPPSDQKDGPMLRGEAELLYRAYRRIEKFKNRVLAIIELDKDDERARRSILENAGTTSFITISDEVLFGEDARNYLRILAEKNGAPLEDDLFSIVTDDDKGYTSLDLRKAFDEWLTYKLKNDYYPQYREVLPANHCVATQKVKGSAYQELEQLVGLTQAKKVIHCALDYYKAQKLFRSLGMEEDRPAMHMVFTGNPGTAKTTVARLFAAIMKENDLLSKGSLVEVGRADLVGKYVGWTATQVQDAFKRAKGGVLFIDEAYALVEDKEGLYGDEAINTIVQEMENHRQDTIVIFAGYPDKMESFLRRNPGMRSRIAFHVPFEDYSPAELYEIGELLARRSGRKLDADVREKLLPELALACQQEDFGNGRFMRNVVEQAKMAQASRLVLMDVAQVGREDIALLKAEDFQMELAPRQRTRKMIGF